MKSAVFNYKARLDKSDKFASFKKAVSEEDDPGMEESDDDDDVARPMARPN